MYRGVDTKLNREVAIKVLSDSVAHDPDRLARLSREARILASLNHRGIAAIYGLEEHEVCALVMELVNGVTLAERIARAPLNRDRSADATGRGEIELERRQRDLVAREDDGRARRLQDELLAVVVDRQRARYELARRTAVVALLDVIDRHITRQLSFDLRERAFGDAGRFHDRVERELLANSKDRLLGRLA